MLFQSTPPVWGATPPGRSAGRCRNHFNPRPPCGGRLRQFPAADKLSDISIHAPRVGGDPRYDHAPGHGNISIHAPRVGGDRVRLRLVISRLSFQSTPPVWGATRLQKKGCVEQLFQSTPPVWGATLLHGGVFIVVGISIHAPRVGGDQKHHEDMPGTRNFNPRPPCGGRRP